MMLSILICAIASAPWLLLLTMLFFELRHHLMRSPTVTEVRRRELKLKVIRGGKP